LVIVESVAESYTSPRRAAAHRFLAGITAIGLTSAVGSVGVIATYYPLRHSSDFLQWILVLVLMTGESAAVHLPSEVILPVAGWLLIRQHDLGFLGILGVSVVAALGNTLGSGLLYVAGARGGRPLLRKYGRYFHIDEEDLDGLEAKMRRYRTAALLTSRVLPVVRTYSGFVAGLIRVPPLLFLSLTFIGSLIWSLLFVVLGVELGAHWSSIQRPAEITGVLILAGLFLGLVALTANQFRRLAD
jgi:membrane protein DedA with SNARE-associated domain